MNKRQSSTPQKKLPISAVIIAQNEQKNIGAAIDSVQFADDILVVDSGSTDNTVEVAKKKGARVLYEKWRGYGQQKNFATSKARHDWVLNIDADERISPELAQEIQEIMQTVLTEQSDAVGFEFPRKTYYLNQWIRHGGWYPNHLVRFANRKHAKWTEPHVHESWQTTGKLGRTKHPLDHFAFHSISEQIETNLRFAKLGSKELIRKGHKPSLLKLIFKPTWKFIDTYFFRRGFLDGIRGFIISVNAAHSLFLKYAFVFERKLKSENPDH